MKRLLAGALALFSALTFGATLSPITLLNPAGSTSGQVIASTGPSTPPAWSTVTLSGLTGTVPISNGGTGATSASAALSNLGGLSTASAASTYLTQTNASSTYATIANLALKAPLASPALTGTPTAPAPATATNNTQIATTSFGYNLLAAPPAIGSATPAAGTFTTLKGNSLAKVFATNVSGQSIASGANTAVTGWTVGFDANSNFNVTTGTFTAPATGYYVVSGQFTWGTIAGAGAAGAMKAVVYANGAATNLAGVAPMSNTTQQTNSVNVSGVVSLSAGQTIVLNAFQNSGSSVALATAAGFNWVSIYQLP